MHDDPGRGSPVGPYDLLVPIGTGGMARVWAARARATGQVVALKLLLPDLQEHEQFQQMFFDEACIASRIQHPNVCATHELAHDNGILYLAMEWIDGPSLVHVLRPTSADDGNAPRCPIHPRVAARIVADACAGLHAAHELRGPNGRPLEVVHRDVSPHNLLLGSDGSVKITDFGVAKALGKSHMTLAGQVKGKLAYMSPEQLTGGSLDRRSDVFALGIVLYEISTGEKPFLGDHDPQVMAAIMLGNYEPPSRVMPGYPPELEQIVVRALASEPKHRYPSALEMKRALEAWLAASGPPVLASHVAALVAERCGGEVAARAEKVQRALTGVALPAAATTARGALAVEGRAGGATRGAVSIVGATVLGLALGLGVLGYVRATIKAKHGAAERPSPPVVVLPARAAIPAPASSLSPAGATLELDDVSPARGDDLDARPEDGGAVAPR